MLLAHGFGCDQNMWRFITPEFAANYKIILFDYVGSGNSDLQAYSPERYSELNGYVQDILEICESLLARRTERSSVEDFSSTTKSGQTGAKPRFC